MAVTPGNIPIGICTVTFDGVDLGATTGDVSVKANQEVARILVDNYGKAPVGAVEAGVSIVVTVPLTERAFTQLAKVYDGGAVVTDGVTPANQKLTVGRLAGEDVNTGALVLHPQHRAVDKLNYDLTIYKAFVSDWGDYAFSSSKQVSFTVSFEGMIDTGRADGDQLFCIGDSTATA